MGDKAGEEEVGGRDRPGFRTVVAILISIVSVLGAVADYIVDFDATQLSSTA